MFLYYINKLCQIFTPPRGIDIGALLLLNLTREFPSRPISRMNELEKQITSTRKDLSDTSTS